MIVSNSFQESAGLLHSRYQALATNTIDYWMLPEDRSMSYERLGRAISGAKVRPSSTIQLYIHVPFCAQRCRFCAFSGGNDLNFKQAERYSRLVVDQLNDLIGRTQVANHPIRSVNIGGGSPDLIDTHINHVLQAVRDVPGVSDSTEISVECTLSTVSREFIDALARFNVSKISFGVQSLHPQVRKHMRQPKSLVHLDRVLEWIGGRIPVVNADLITGLPGQDINVVLDDLNTLMADPRINAISSYLLTAGASPALIAAMATGTIPPMPEPEQQALMRLHTYSTFLRHGWIRRGTNTYVDPSRVAPEIIDQLAGNECIGTRHYEDFLLGVGPQAVSFLPGARAENEVDIKAWASAIETGGNPFHLAKCSDQDQRDTSVWVFPLRWEGLPCDHFDDLVQSQALTPDQIQLWDELLQEGLIVRVDDDYRLSILGEVFMGRLVRDLKQPEARQAVDEYIAEGHQLGAAIAAGKLSDDNAANNRQRVDIAGAEG